MEADKKSTADSNFEHIHVGVDALPEKEQHLKDDNSTESDNNHRNSSIVEMLRAELNRLSGENNELRAEISAVKADNKILLENNNVLVAKLKTADEQKSEVSDKLELELTATMTNGGGSSGENGGILKQQELAPQESFFPPYIRDILLNGQKQQLRNLDELPCEPRFPPYMRYIQLDDQKQLRDLEEIPFGPLITARLALFSNLKKYPVTLAEIHRRVSPPECLNTSYLSGILRRVLRKNGGSILRSELAKFDCGLEPQTGKRVSNSQMTVFSTLCECEAIQLSVDLGKLTANPQNGFPHHQLAKELYRRALHSSPEQQKQRLESVKSSMEILSEVISIVKLAMEQETQQLTMSNELIAAMGDGKPQQQKGGGQQLMPPTLNEFKRFARLSHCFGNRAMLTCWQSLLQVFGQYKAIVSYGSMEGCISGFEGSGVEDGQSLDLGAVST